MTPPILEKLFAAMEGSRGVPALERIVTSVLGSLNDHEKGNRHLVADIVKDAGLTQKVLKLANSAMYAPFANEKASVSGALNVLGADTLLHIVLSTAMVTDDEAEGDKNLSKTMLASELARTVCAERSEDASIAALMYDLGRLMATKYLPNEMAAVELKVAAGVEPDAASLDVLGMSLQQIGTEIASRWKLPRQIMSIIDGSGDPALVGVARFSSAVSALIHDGRMEEAQALVTELDVPGADKSMLAGLVSRKGEKIAQGRTPVAALSTEAVLTRLLAALSEEKKATVEALASAMFPTLAETLNTSHCLLFMATKSGDFCVRYGYGKGVDSLRSALRISAEFKPTAFHAAIKNNVDVSIADVSKLKAAALPDRYRDLLPAVTKFLILPIAHGRVSGLMYCDWEAAMDLPQAELSAIRKLRDLFLPFFPR